LAKNEMIFFRHCHLDDEEADYLGGFTMCQLPEKKW